MDQQTRKSTRAKGLTVRWTNSEREEIQAAADGCVLRPTDIIRIATMRACAEFRKTGTIALNATAPRKDG